MVTFDLETTGVDTKTDRIVQICISENGITKTRLINPEIPIPQEATDVHGITDDMVKDAPTFKQIAQSLYNMVNGKDLCGFNSNAFDVPLLINEFARCGLVLDVSGVNLIDVSNIYRRLNPRDLDSAYFQYLGKHIDGAHNAENDVIATLELLKAMTEKHTELDIQDLNIYSNYDKKRLDLSGFFLHDKDENVIFAKGKNKGKIATSEPSYLKWMIEKGDFEQDTKKIAKQIYENTTRTP